MQVFYARDNKTKGRLKVVLEGKRKIVGVDRVTDEEDYMGYQEGDEPAYVRIDHNEALIVDAPKDSQIIVNYVIIMQMLYQ